ncbi:hypothetical protein AB0B45_02660 [Nonomuraea sp. NPDC049152]|uniref:hypothetical protein n=1 Tax=Nonomuraea sp. NPDC049152 TaxID=3154350 RepID=UPI00340D8203
MISPEVRLWVLGMATMSIASWVAATASLLILIDADKVPGHAAALLLVWISAISVPVTFQTILCWRRVRAARRVLMLGQKHKRMFEIMSGEIASLR